MKSVLIVDDDEHTAEVLSHILTMPEIGCASQRVHVATTFERAVALLGAFKYDAVLVDYLLDSPHNAIDLIPHIPPGTRIILLSAYNPIAIEHIELFHAFLHKPFAIEDLCEKISGG